MDKDIAKYPDFVIRISQNNTLGKCMINSFISFLAELVGCRT